MVLQSETTVVSPTADAKKAFQRLKTKLHHQMVDAIDFSKAGELPEEDLRIKLRGLAEHLCMQQDIALDQTNRDIMVREILDEIYGFGPLEPLMNDPEISDVLVNGADRVFIERNGLLEETDISFADDEHLLQLIHRLVGRAGRRIDEVSPMVDAKLPDGSRLNAVIPPLALKGPTLSIRRFRTQALLFDDMVKKRSLAPDMARFLEMAVHGRLNILISGGTGAGKTTLLNNLSRYISAKERIVTIEQTAELQLQQPDVVSLEARPSNIEGQGEINQRDLLKNSLRMRPDRVIVGESRGGEVLEMLQAMNTGHDGSMSTVHANDTRDALDRLELMIALSGAELPNSIARRYIASAVYLLVHISRLPNGERKVMRISELIGFQNGEYMVEDLFVFRITSVEKNGQVNGAFYATGHHPVAMNWLTQTNFDDCEDLFHARELKLSDLPSEQQDGQEQ